MYHKKDHLSIVFGVYWLNLAKIKRSADGVIQSSGGDSRGWPRPPVSKSEGSGLVPSDGTIHARLHSLPNDPVKKEAGN